MLGRLSIVSALACLVLAPSARAWPQIPHAQDRPPGPALSPAEAVEKMTVPPGFSVEVVASEPDIVNPVAMTFDEKGRAWITESLEYPRKSAGPGRDRIKVLEDTDGDGKADKFTIFADGLNIPSGVAVGAGGVWVANSPDILFLKDTDGDGKADTREVVVTGFGREDTHELPNSLTWGPDGWLYGWNGVFNPAKIDYRGKTYKFTCAIFRINPKTRDFEVFCEGVSNPWGIAFNEVGDAFASACVIDHLWHLTETGYYHRQGGPYPPFTWVLESIVDHKHQKAAYCGIHYFDSDAYPESYRGKLFMGNIHAGAINVDRLERAGSTYRGKTEPDFLQANDAWFMPVVQKTGPDGSLYILDWYDRYHCYQDANRDPNGIDRLKGRLYRIRYKDGPRAPKFDMAAETDDQLLKRLDGPNDFVRDTARRVLQERDTAATRPKLMAIILDPDVTHRTRMQALWTMVGTGHIDTEDHLKILDHPDASVRAWGVRAAGNFRSSDPAIREAVVGLERTSGELEIRLQIAITIGKLPGDPLPLLVRLVQSNGGDEHLRAIAWQNLQSKLDGRGFDLARLVAKVDLRDSASLVQVIPKAIDRLLNGPNPQPEAAVGLLAALLQSATKPSELDAARRSIRLFTDKMRDPSIPGDVRNILAKSLPVALGYISPNPQGRFLVEHMTQRSLKWDAWLLSVAQGDKVAISQLRQSLIGAQLDDKQSLEALEVLVAAGEESVLAFAVELFDKKDKPLSFLGDVLASMGKLDSPKVAEVVLDAYPKLESELQPMAVELLTQRANWTVALLDAVAKKVIPASSLNVNQVRKLASSKDPAIAAKVKATWGTVRESRNPAREQVINDIRGSLKEAHGDPFAGAQVFRNVCGQCHKIYGEGQEVGPEVTLNGRASYEQLLSNVFDPSLVIGPSYQATTISTTDGRTLTGLVAEDGPRQVVLKLQGGKLETIPRSLIEETTLSQLSLMPEGIEAQLKPGEVADLFAFLTLDRPPGDPKARPIPGTPSGIRK